ncbi:MAG: hypothetical protein OEZ06_14010 [Myxococcales bacterium]|nr:hypothetical protein [Myxococcales bacterium]
MEAPDREPQYAQAPAPRPRRPRWLEHAHDLFFVACAALLWLFKVRYGFENNDHQQYLLLPYRHIYPDFLPGDWFTWETSHYHQSFSWLMRALHAIAGERFFAQAVLLTHAAVLAAFGAALLAVARAAKLGRASAWVALGLLGVVRWEALAGAAITKGVLLPAATALPPYVLACAAWVAKRPLRAGLWLGLSGLLHANYAVLGPLSLAPLLALQALRRRSLRTLLEVAIPFTVVASPTLYAVASGLLAPDSAPGELALFFRVRAPHHYDVGSLATLDLAWLASLLLLAAPALLQRPERRLAQLTLVLLALLGLAWVAGALQLTGLVRAFLWRLSLPLCAIAALGHGAALRDAMATRDRVGIPLQLGGLLLLLAYTLPNKHLREAQPLLLWSLLPLAAASLAHCLPRDRKLRSFGALPALALLLWLCLAHAGLPPLGPGLPLSKIAAEARKTQPVQARWHPPGQLGQLMAWVRHNTPKEARFLAPPGFINFRLHARRAIYVDWKCTPMRGDELRVWRDRMLGAMGTADFPALGYALRHASTRAYRKQPAATLAALARREGLDHVISSRPRRENEQAGLELLARFGAFGVYRVQREQP